MYAVHEPILVDKTIKLSNLPERRLLAYFQPITADYVKPLRGESSVAHVPSSCISTRLHPLDILLPPKCRQRTDDSSELSISGDDHLFSDGSPARLPSTAPQKVVHSS
ncbi:hypothetical protein EVAR_99534_1 [Eumeta japonica]|uniref:Uncharacterized protein n=1 Tax=Eumeta variegata TaxID=151549 RepID=A0A4C1SS41_EUMVA|nr:hypothetical protein EVAR_99534_1 [Eumeta japonica]